MATSSTIDLCTIDLALELIRKRRKSLDPSISPPYNLVSDSDYCFKLFATRSIRPVANKHVIARINALLDQVKRDNSISISWAPADTSKKITP